MSPGKWSRRQTTPNKPPVCHKAPLIPLIPGIMPWQRNANLFFKWEGSPPQGSQQRSWNVNLEPWPPGPILRATAISGGIQFVLTITFSDPFGDFRYFALVASPTQIFLMYSTLFAPLQRVDPWYTGLVRIPSSFFTLACSFEAMA